MKKMSVFIWNAGLKSIDLRKYQLVYLKLLTYNGFLVRKNLVSNCNSLFYRLFDCIPLKQGLRPASLDNSSNSLTV